MAVNAARCLTAARNVLGQKPFRSTPGSAVPSAARRALQLCADRRDQGFVTQPGSSLSTRCERIFAGSGVIPGQAASAQGSFEMKGVLQNVPKSHICRGPTGLCGHIYGVTSAWVSLLGGGCLSGRGTEGTVTRVGRSCDHLGVSRPQHNIRWDNPSPRDLPPLN